MDEVGSPPDQTPGSLVPHLLLLKEHMQYILANGYQNCPYVDRELLAEEKDRAYLEYLHRTVSFQ